VVLTEYYRNYELPWEADPEERERLRRYLLIGLAVFLVLGIGLPLIHLARPTVKPEEAVPPRLARLMVEERPKPPPPKPIEQPQEQPKPVEKPRPVEKPLPDTRKKMEQSASMRAIRDALADLRDPLDTAALGQTKTLTNNVSQDPRSDRSLIASKAGSGSSGITTANASRGFGGGAGALSDHTTLAMRSGIADTAARGTASRKGVSGKAARSPEEIELVFDRNKGAIYALYSRALREQPDLQGKLVLEFTIAPSGDVTMCRVVSSELKDPELEQKIVARVKLFHFEARDVETVTTTKPIEFFPA
jgi:periplasmic protein TonB